MAKAKWFSSFPEILAFYREQSDVTVHTSYQNLSHVLSIISSSLNFNLGIMFDAVGIGQELAISNHKSTSSAGKLSLLLPREGVIRRCMSAVNLNNGVEKGSIVNLGRISPQISRLRLLFILFLLRRPKRRRLESHRLGSIVTTMFISHSQCVLLLLWV